VDGLCIFSSQDYENAVFMGEKMPPAEALLVFQNTREAVIAERELLDRGLEVRVMPMPRSLGPVCGMVLRVNSADVERAKALLGESAGVYCRKGEGIVPWPG
jgi:hypothetical protein